MDFKLELGAIIGANTEMGAHITVAEADKMIFGYVLLNDWSAAIYKLGNINRWAYFKPRHLQHQPVHG